MQDSGLGRIHTLLIKVNVPIRALGMKVERDRQRQTMTRKDHTHQAKHKHKILDRKVLIQLNSKIVK